MIPSFSDISCSWWWIVDEEWVVGEFGTSGPVLDVTLHDVKHEKAPLLSPGWISSVDITDMGLVAVWKHGYCSCTARSDGM